MTIVTTDITRTSEKSQCYRNFINALRSPATKRVYINSLKRYMNHLKTTDVDRLLEINNQKIIESQLIDYIMSLRQDGLSYATMKHMLAPIFTFYLRNDIPLNRKKIARYLGEYKIGCSAGTVKPLICVV
jgi:hypothetical protein